VFYKIVRRSKYRLLLGWFPAWAILGAVLWRGAIEKLYEVIHRRC
jgi:hypothetical protein